MVTWVDVMDRRVEPTEEPVKIQTRWLVRIRYRRKERHEPRHEVDLVSFGFTRCPLPTDRTEPLPTTPDPCKSTVGME